MLESTRHDSDSTQTSFTCTNDDSRRVLGATLNHSTNHAVKSSNAHYQHERQQIEPLTITHQQVSKGSNSMSNPEQPSSRKRKLETPVLSDMLDADSDDSINGVIKFKPVDNVDTSLIKSIKKRASTKKIEEPDSDSSREAELSKLINFRIESEPPSTSSDAYASIVPEWTRRVEVLAADNSLFLSVARALLYKIYFVDRKYEFLLRCVYLSEVSDEFTFDSDLALQELLRKNLCIYWLSNVVAGEFVPHCKYSKDFASPCDFIYQVYQLSVNNFSRNRLFAKYALEDLADMLKLKILVFNTTVADHNSLSVYEPVNHFQLKLNDFVYLSVDKKDSACLFSWMMPKAREPVLGTTILSPLNSDKYFIQLHRQPFVYAHHVVLLDWARLFTCFSHESLLSSACLFLYLRFMSECDARTLTTVHELKFGDLVPTGDLAGMCSYLNRLGGERRFNSEYYSNFATLTTELFKNAESNENDFVECSQQDAESSTSPDCYYAPAEEEPTSAAALYPVEAFPSKHTTTFAPYQHTSVHQSIASISSSSSAEESASRLAINLSRNSLYNFSMSQLPLQASSFSSTAGLYDESAANALSQMRRYTSDWSVRQAHEDTGSVDAQAGPDQFFRERRSSVALGVTPYSDDYQIQQNVAKLAELRLFGKDHHTSSSVPLEPTEQPIDQSQYAQIKNSKLCVKDADGFTLPSAFAEPFCYKPEISSNTASCFSPVSHRATKERSYMDSVLALKFKHKSATHVVSPPSGEYIINTTDQPRFSSI